MIQNPLVSVIIPTFNRDKFLERCLRSVLNQQTDITYDIICINDGSTDQTSQILKKYEEKISIIHNTFNKGLPSSLNLGINTSTSRYIVRVDSDDYVSTNFVELLTLTLEKNPNFNAVACDYIEVGMNGEEIIKNCQEDPIACGIMFNRDSITSIGLYNEFFKVHEDRDLRERYDSKYKVERLPIPLYRYIKHANNLTGDLYASRYYLDILTEKRKTK